MPGSRDLWRVGGTGELGRIFDDEVEGETEVIDIDGDGMGLVGGVDNVAELAISVAGNLIQ
jgi:hypothetical protein